MTTKYAKIIDEETKMCEVGTGTDVDYYILKGFKELDVEQAHNGSYYLIGYAPQKPLEQQLQEKKQEKHQELKSKRNEYLISNEANNNYDFSENDKFNIINLIGYTEEDKQAYLEFIKSLKVKYDNYKETINKAANIEELESIIIKFGNNKI